VGRDLQARAKDARFPCTSPTRTLDLKPVRDVLVRRTGIERHEKQNGFFRPHVFSLASVELARSAVTSAKIHR